MMTKDQRVSRMIKETITFETSLSRLPNNKRQPEDITQSPQKNIFGTPTRGIPLPRQLNNSYSFDQSKDRLERQTRSRAKKARDEVIDENTSDSDRSVKTVELAEDIKLLHIDSAEVKSDGGKKDESRDDDSGDDIHNPPRAQKIDHEREITLSARRAALEARSYTEKSGGSKSEEESEFAASINSKQVLQQTWMMKKKTTTKEVDKMG